MILNTQIAKVVNGLIDDKFPNIPIYANEVKEGLKKPSFFVQLRPISKENESVNFRSCRYNITITYFSKANDEIDKLTKANEIEELFGYGFSLDSSTYARITEFDFEFVGQDDDTLQLSMTISFFEEVKRIETSEIATTLVLNNE